MSCMPKKRVFKDLCHCHKKKWIVGQGPTYDTDYNFVICSLHRLYIVNSLSYKKMDWDSPVRKSVFWYDNDKDAFLRHCNSNVLFSYPCFPGLLC